MAHDTLQFPLTLLFFKRCSFIILPFTPGKAQFHFSLTILYKVYLKRDQGKAFLPQFTNKFFDFPLMEK